MKVYIVTGWDGEDSWIEKVFKSQEDAAKFATQLGQQEEEDLFPYIFMAREYEVE